MNKETLNNYLDKLLIMGLYMFSIFSAWSISGAQIGFTISGFAWISKMIINKKIIYQKHPVNIPVIALLLLTVFSAVISIDAANSMKGSLKTILLMFLYFIIISNVKNEKQLKTLILLFVISCIGESVFALSQYFGFTTYKAPVGDLRISGSAGHPIFLGEIMMFGLCAAVSASIFKIFDRKTSFFIGIGIVLMFLALTFTQARGAWIGFFIGIIIIGFMLKKRLLAIFIIILMLLVLSRFIFPNSELVKRGLSIFNLSHGSNKERIAMYKSGVLIMAEHPLGIGVHNVHYFYPEYKQAEAVHKNQDHLHSNFIQIGVERGILGLAAFIAFIIMFFKSVYGALKSSDSNIKAAIIVMGISAFCGFVISGITEYNYGTSMVVEIMWFIAGLSVFASLKNASS